VHDTARGAADRAAAALRLVRGAPGGRPVAPHVAAAPFCHENADIVRLCRMRLLW
jgi:hypothetical protein